MANSLFKELHELRAPTKGRLFEEVEPGKDEDEIIDPDEIEDKEDEVEEEESLERLENENPQELDDVTREEPVVVVEGVYCKKHGLISGLGESLRTRCPACGTSDLRICESVIQGASRPLIVDIPRKKRKKVNESDRLRRQRPVTARKRYVESRNLLTEDEAEIICPDCGFEGTESDFDNEDGRMVCEYCGAEVGYDVPDQVDEEDDDLDADLDIDAYDGEPDDLEDIVGEEDDEEDEIVVESHSKQKSRRSKRVAKLLEAAGAPDYVKAANRQGKTQIVSKYLTKYLQS